MAAVTLGDAAPALSAAAACTLSDALDASKFPRAQLAALHGAAVNPIFAPRSRQLLLQALQALGKAAALLAVPFGEVCCFLCLARCCQPLFPHEPFAAYIFCVVATHTHTPGQWHCPVQTHRAGRADVL